MQLTWCQILHRHGLVVVLSFQPSAHLVTSNTQLSIMTHHLLFISLDNQLSLNWSETGKGFLLMYTFKFFFARVLSNIIEVWDLAHHPGQVSYVQPGAVMEEGLCMCFPQPDHLGLQTRISSMLHGFSRALSDFMYTSLCWCNEKESHWSWGMQAWELDSWLSETPDTSEIHLNLSRPIQSSWSHKDGWLLILPLCTAWQPHTNSS